MAEKMEVDAPGNGQLLSPITPIKKFAVIGSGHPHESVELAEQPEKDGIHVNNGLMEEPMVPPSPPKNIVSQRRRESRTQPMPSPPVLRCIDPRTLAIPHQDARPLLVSGADRFTNSMKRKRMGMENDDTNYNRSFTTQSGYLNQDRISAGSKEKGLGTNTDDIPLSPRANKKPRMQEFEEAAFNWDDWVTFDNELCDPNSRSHCVSTDYIPIINHPIGKWPSPPRYRPTRPTSPPSFAAIGAELQHTPEYHIAVMNWGREMENYKYPDGISEPKKDIWRPYSQLRPMNRKQQQAPESIPSLVELTEVGKLLRQYYHQRAGQFILDKLLDAPEAVPDHVYACLDTQLAEVERRSRLGSKYFYLQPNIHPQK